MNNFVLRKPGGCAFLILMMKKAIFSFFVAFCIFLAPGVASAADENPLFMPTSAWLVGPASVVPLGDGKAKLPCVMVNQFDNGFTLRISGGGQRIMAVALDVRQDVFETGKAYSAGLSVDDKFSGSFTGKAYNGATLILNTQSAAEFYGAVAQARLMKISIGSGVFEFVMLGAGDGLSRIESCFNGGGQGAAPIARVEEGTKHGYTRTIMPEAAKTESMKQPVVADKAAQPENALPQKGNASGKRFSIDTLLKNVVKDIAGIETAAGEEKGMRTETVASSVPERKQETMLARSWVDPAVHGKGNQGAQQPVAVPGESRNWRAMKGNSLREILELWSAQENIDVMWYADRDFSVQKSVSAQGAYEQAVLGLLEQYEKEGERPVGRIYNDAARGKRVLLVESQEGAE